MILSKHFPKYHGSLSRAQCSLIENGILSVQRGISKWLGSHCWQRLEFCLYILGHLPNCYVNLNVHHSTFKKEILFLFIKNVFHVSCEMCVKKYRPRTDAL